MGRNNNSITYRRRPRPFHSNAAADENIHSASLAPGDPANDDSVSLSAGASSMMRSPGSRVLSHHLGRELHVSVPEDSFDTEREEDNPDEAPYTVGLALSGGGIRSASFCSGVLAEFIEKRLYNGAVDDGHGNDRGELDESTSISRPRVVSHLQSLKPVEKIVMSAVSGGGYTAASYLSWARRHVSRATNEFTPSQPDDDAMRSPLYFTREYLRNMHYRVGYVCADYANCRCSWRFLLAVLDYLCFFGAFVVLTVLSILLYSPSVFMYCELLVSLFGVNLLKADLDDKAYEDAYFPWLRIGPIWLGIKLSLYTLAFGAICLCLRFFKRRRMSYAARFISGFICDTCFSALLFGATIPVTLASNTLEAMIDTLQLSDDTEFYLSLIKIALIALLVLSMSFVPFQSQVGRNYLAILLVFLLVGGTALPVRLCDQTLLDAAGVNDAPGINCSAGLQVMGVPATIFGRHIKYSSRWGTCLSFGAFLMVMLCTPLYHWHGNLLGKFYQWRLRRAFFNRGDLSADSKGHVSAWNEIKWSFWDSCRRDKNLDPSMKDGCTYMFIDSNTDAIPRRVDLEYVTSYTVNLWTRIKIFFMTLKPGVKPPDKLFGALDVEGPFKETHDKIAQNTYYWTSTGVDHGIMVDSPDGMYRLDDRFASTQQRIHTYKEKRIVRAFQRLLERVLCCRSHTKTPTISTPTGCSRPNDSLFGPTESFNESTRTLATAYSRYSLLAHTPEVQRDKSRFKEKHQTDTMPISEAMAISGAVVAPDMGNTSAGRIARTALTFSGVSLGWEVSFSQLGRLARMVSIGCFFFVFAPSFCHGLNMSGVSTQSWWAAPVCRWIFAFDIFGFFDALSSSHAIATMGIVAFAMLSVLVSASSRSFVAAESRRTLREQPRWKTFLRMTLRIVSMMTVVRLIRNVLGMSDHTRGPALTSKQMYRKGRVRHKDMDSDQSTNSTDDPQHELQAVKSNILQDQLAQPAVPPRLDLTDGGHEEILGILPLLMKRCDEIYIAYGSDGADTADSEYKLLNAIEMAETTLGCAFHVDHEVFDLNTGQTVKITDVRNALRYTYTSTYLEDCDPFGRKAGSDVDPLPEGFRPWSFKFHVTYPPLPAPRENMGKDGPERRGKVKHGTIYFLQPRDQPIRQVNRYSNTELDLDMERARQILTYNGKNMWKIDSDTADCEYNTIHENLYGGLCECWSTRACARKFCQLTNNCCILGRFPSLFTFNQCYYPRQFRAYHYHGRHAMLQALQVQSYPYNENTNELDMTDVLSIQSESSTGTASASIDVSAVNSDSYSHIADIPSPKAAKRRKDLTENRTPAQNGRHERRRSLSHNNLRRRPIRTNDRT